MQHVSTASPDTPLVDQTAILPTIAHNNLVSRCRLYIVKIEALMSHTAMRQNVAYISYVA